jgi:hypothetical protein
VSAGRWRVVVSDGAGGTRRRGGHPAVVCLALVLLLVGVGCATPPVRTSDSLNTTGPGSLECSLPDSLRVKMLAALTRGDIPGAIGLWQLHTGQQAPAWLRNLQGAYSAANQLPGRCQEVARIIHTAFSNLGRSPEYIAFRSAQEAPHIVFELSNGKAAPVSRNSYHVAVRVGDMLYDAYAGPHGVKLADYMARMHAISGVKWDVVSTP